MVKGISRQVIVLHPKESDLFEEAIFVLSDSAVGNNAVTDNQLLQEAGRLMGNHKKRKYSYIREAVWVSMGALITSTIFLIFSLF